MNVRTICLAILNFGDATGYEIRKLSTEGKFAYFIDASFGAIYPALNRLEQDGRVTSREEREPCKPPRKVYSITDTGRDELLTALTEPPARDIFRSEFLLIAMCADMLDPPTLRRAVETHRRQLEAELAQLNEILFDCDHPGTRWSAEYGVSCMTRSLEYLDAKHADLEKLAAPADKVAAE